MVVFVSQNERLSLFLDVYVHFQSIFIFLEWKLVCTQNESLWKAKEIFCIAKRLTQNWAWKVEKSVAGCLIREEKKPKIVCFECSITGLDYIMKRPTRRKWSSYICKCNVLLGKYFWHTRNHTDTNTEINLLEVAVDFWLIAVRFSTSKRRRFTLDDI